VTSVSPKRRSAKLLGLGRVRTEDFLAAYLDLYYEPSELSREAALLKGFSERPR
jgi:hypothetical protein